MNTTDTARRARRIRARVIRECANEAAAIARRHSLQDLANDADHIVDALWALDLDSPEARDVLDAASKQLNAILDGLDAHLIALEPA